MPVAALPDSVAARKLHKRLKRQVGQATGDFAMIADGDRVMVAMSGGKDSHTLLDLLIELRERAPVRFDVVTVNTDQKQPGFPGHVLPEYFRARGVDWHVIEQDTYSTVTRVVPEGKTLYRLCSRMRRGALYAWAADNGITKIALGHHRDDIIKTFFLNLRELFDFAGLEAAAGDDAQQAPPGTGRGVPIRWMTLPADVRT